ncbi:ABC transporter substrate-binding protein [Microvirga puerhi]|uniref:ABC transporter substrate-binding protein n=1 Tax=Microvirga puerhi TaxID=2876078 RepID=A0ABS7VKR7_9HYPH|nr:ABC transporter substrate-binding protein [Microvirga puerhi]MBZ6075751.1 ABC transporter substrate-binding protein [Microvirga puerhi]
MLNYLTARRAAVALASVLMLASAGFATTASAAAIVIGSEGAVPPLDPHRMTGTPGLRVIDAIFDPLIREDLSKPTEVAPELVGALAESWSVSPDGLTYTLKLRQGVTFHDGKPLDAAAVQLNFSRMMDKDSPIFDTRASGNMTFLTRWIKSTSAVDPSTFQIVLKEPFSGLPRLLSDRRAGIVSPAAIEQNKGDQLGLHPVGTGPFTLQAFQQGQQLNLSRNPSYWGHKPGVDQIIVRPVTDPTAMAIGMQTGQIDVIPSASSQQVAQLKVDPSLQVQYPEPANEYFVRLNTRAELTKNPLFRQALNYAVNRDSLTALLDGQVTPATGPVPLGNELPREKMANAYRYDPAKAKELLSAAGIATPITLKLLAPNSGPGFGQAAQIIALLQQDLKAVGINLQPQFLEFATLVTTEGPGYKDDVQGSFNGWTTGADSTYWLERMFSGSQQPPSGVNRGWYNNAEVDRLFTAARAETDEAKRNDLYRQAAELISKDAPWIFLYQDKLPRILRARVTGIVPARSVFFDYSRIGVR